MALGAFLERGKRGGSPRLRYGALAALAMLLLLAPGCTEAIERGLVYSPESYSEDFDPSARAGTPLETLRIRSPGGAVLVAYYAPAPAYGPALLWLHGNGGNIADRVKKLAKLNSALGVGVLAVDYRGYGLSTGEPSEAGLYADARAAFDALAKRSDVDPARVFVFGESLGGAVAVELAGRRPVAGLIVASSFTSLPDVAKMHYGFLGSFAESRFDSLGKVPKLDCPKLFVHGQKDDFIPPSMTRSLYAAAKAPKQLLLVEGAGHNDIELRGALAESMRRLVLGAGTPTKS